jgi:hypothetical protein
MEIRSPDDAAPVTKVRIARPTDRLAEVVGFYRDALGLEQIASFEGHAGYDGVMLALPGKRDHLEFTHHERGSPCSAPTKDNLLVFYVEDAGAIRGWPPTSSDTGTNRSSLRIRTGWRRG